MTSLKTSHSIIQTTKKKPHSNTDSHRIAPYPHTPLYLYK